VVEHGIGICLKIQAEGEITIALEESLLLVELEGRKGPEEEGRREHHILASNDPVTTSE